MRFSTSLILRFFFSSPTNERSMASSKSAWSISFLLARPASNAPSLMMFAKSAPARPAVCLATTERSTLRESFTPLECTFKIAKRPSKSGLSTKTCLSKRPALSKAASSISGLLVAASTITGVSVPKPSISARSWLSVCSLSSFPPICPPDALDLPIASISSIKMMEGASFLA